MKLKNVKLLKAVAPVTGGKTELLEAELLSNGFLKSGNYIFNSNLVLYAEIQEEEKNEDSKETKITNKPKRSSSTRSDKSALK